MQKTGNPRPQGFFCSYCKEEFIIQIPFGAYIDMQVGVSACILEERPGQHDRLISDIWCPKCGCVVGLTMIEPTTPAEIKTDGTN